MLKTLFASVALFATVTGAMAEPIARDETMRTAARTAWGATGTEEANKDVVRNAIQAVFVERRLDRVPDFYGDPYLQNNPRIPDGIPAMQAYFGTIFAAFPDYAPTIDMIVAEGDLVSVYLTWRGTHTGAAFEGVEATGAQVVTRTADIFRIRDGKIVEHWDIVDRSGMLMPLGLMTLRQAAE